MRTESLITDSIHPLVVSGTPWTTGESDYYRVCKNDLINHHRKFSHIMAKEGSLLRKKVTRRESEINLTGVCLLRSRYFSSPFDIQFVCPGSYTLSLVETVHRTIYWHVSTGPVPRRNIKTFLYCFRLLETRLKKKRTRLPERKYRVHESTTRFLCTDDNPYRESSRERTGVGLTTRGTT